MTSSDEVPRRSQPATTSNPPGLRSACPGAAVVRGAVDGPGAPRLGAELDGRIAVGTHVLVVDLEKRNTLDPAVIAVLAGAAGRLHDERAGSLVLRNASVPLLHQLGLMRLDHLFELDT